MNLSHVIIGPVVTEKSMNIVDKIGHHTLYVHANSTKSDIKSAILLYFGAQVSSVRIVKLPTKTRVRGKQGPQIKRKKRKKAIISLKTGETLDLLKLTTPPKKPKKAVKKSSPEPSSPSEKKAPKTSVKA